MYPGYRRLMAIFVGCTMALTLFALPALAVPAATTEEGGSGASEAPDTGPEAKDQDQDQCDTSPLAEAGSTVLERRDIAAARGAALRLPDVQVIRDDFVADGYRPTLEGSFGVQASDGTRTVFLPYRAPGGVAQEGIIGVSTDPVGKTQVDSAIVSFDGQEFLVHETLGVESGQAVAAQNYFTCMLSCLSASCGPAVPACARLRFPALVLSCLSVRCAAQFSGCNAIC